MRTGKDDEISSTPDILGNDGENVEKNVNDPSGPSTSTDFDCSLPSSSTCESSSRGRGGHIVDCRLSSTSCGNDAASASGVSWSEAEGEPQIARSMSPYARGCLSPCDNLISSSTGFNDQTLGETFSSSHKFTDEKVVLDADDLIDSTVDTTSSPIYREQEDQKGSFYPDSEHDILSSLFDPAQDEVAGPFDSGLISTSGHVDGDKFKDQLEVEPGRVDHLPPQTNQKRTSKNGGKNAKNSKLSNLKCTSASKPNRDEGSESSKTKQPCDENAKNEVFGSSRLSDIPDREQGSVNHLSILERISGPLSKRLLTLHSIQPSTPESESKGMAQNAENRSLDNPEKETNADGHQKNKPIQQNVIGNKEAPTPSEYRVGVQQTSVCNGLLKEKTSGAAKNGKGYLLYFLKLLYSSCRRYL